MPEGLPWQTDYEKICDFQNLYQAHLRARTNKRRKPEVIRFELHLAEQLSRMSEELKNRTYQMKGYYHFNIHEPKERQVFAAYYPDRVLLHCVCDQVIAPLLGPRLIYDNAACQKGKGPHFAQERFSGFLREYYRRHGPDGYILKCDISQYFASIDHQVLKRQLAGVVRDADVRELIFQYIDSYETAGRPGRGLPLGNQSSQWYAIYYLDPLDRLVKEQLQVRYYIRYMDDCLLLHHSKEFLSGCFVQMKGLLEERLHLSLNSKSQIHPLRKGIEFLGWKFYLSETGKVVRRLKRQSKRRMRRRLSRLEREYAARAVTWEQARSVLASYHGHLGHGNTYRLRCSLCQEVTLCRSVCEPEPE